jgi:hypothetical protein
MAQVLLDLAAVLTITVSGLATLLIFEMVIPPEP